MSQLVSRPKTYLANFALKSITGFDKGIDVTFPGYIIVSFRDIILFRISGFHFKPIPFKVFQNFWALVLFFLCLFIFDVLWFEI